MTANTFAFECPPGSYLTNIYGSGKDAIAGLAFRCSNGDRSPMFVNPNGRTDGKASSQNGFIRYEQSTGGGKINKLRIVDVNNNDMPIIDVAAAPGISPVTKSTSCNPGQVLYKVDGTSQNGLISDVNFTCRDPKSSYLMIMLFVFVVFVAVLSYVVYGLIPRVTRDSTPRWKN